MWQPRFHYIFCDFVVVTTVSSKSDENTVITKLLIPINAHNQRKYWIAIKENLFRDRAYYPWLSPPKATSIQWVIVQMKSAEKKIKFTYPVAFSDCLLSAAAADTGAGVQGFGITPIDNVHANAFRSGEGYAGSGRIIIVGK